MRAIKALGFVVMGVTVLIAGGVGLFYGGRYLLHAPSLYQALPAKDAVNLPADLNWSVRTMDGKSVSLSEFAGKPLLVNFWATWCMPCRMEMPSLGRLYDHVRPAGYVFLAVTHEEEAAVRKHLIRQPTRMPIYLQDSRVPDVFKTKGIPATFVISPAGRIRWIEERAADWDAPARIQRLQEIAAEK